MAASTRQLIVKNKIVRLINLNNTFNRFDRCDTLCYTRYRHRQSSTPSSSKQVLKQPGNSKSDNHNHHCNANHAADDSKSNSVESIDKVNEDFYGIPEGFKLQQVRMGSESTTPTYKSHSTSVDTSSEYSLQDLDRSTSSIRSKPHSRHKRRKNKTIKADFPTSFGIISFDQASYKKTAGDIEKLALKAQEILKTPGRTIDSPKNTRDSSISNERFQRSITAQSEGKESKSNIFDEQYFGISNSDGKELNTFKNEKKKLTGNTVSRIPMEEEYFKHESYKHKSTPNEVEGDNFFDKQYFDSLLIRENVQHSSTESDRLSDYTQESELNLIDQQYFDNSVSAAHSSSEYNPSSLGAVAEQYFNSQSDVSNLSESIKTHDLENYEHLNSHPASVLSVGDSNESNQPKSTGRLKVRKALRLETEQRSKAVTDRLKPVVDEMLQIKETTKNIVTNDSFLERIKGQRKAYASKLAGEGLQENSALSFAMKVRHNLNTNQDEKADVSDFRIPKAYDTGTEIDKDDGLEFIGKRSRFDSKGFRILDLQVPNFEHMTSSDVCRMLKNRIIYNHDDFLAIDKPYGLPSFGQQDDRLSISGLLPTLVPLLPRSFQASQLHIVQGLDRDVTGAIILAKTPEIAQDIKQMYNNSESCIQRYWAITKGVPKPSEGTVDIPIGEAKVAGRFKPMLRPLYRPSIHPRAKLSKAPSEAAVTEYKVLSRNATVALVECTSLTNGVKHQLRVHLAQALNTPILGDHKYSHLAKLAPQKLDPSTLALLNIRQAKVRHLALHLHLRSVVLTDYKGRMIFLTTRPPIHFADNLKSLKLQMPRK